MSRPLPLLLLFAGFTLIMLMPQPASASKPQLHLKNGSIIRGDILKLDDTKIIIKTSHGVLTIPRDAIIQMIFSKNPPPPPPQKKHKNPLHGLLITGAITFGITYALSFVTGFQGVTAGDQKTIGLWMLPLVGNFLGASGSARDLAPLGTALGIVQLIGAGMLVAGIATSFPPNTKNTPTSLPPLSPNTPTHP